MVRRCHKTRTRVYNLLADVLDFRNGALEVERLGEDDFENLLHIDAVACAAENEGSSHGLCESACLRHISLLPSSPPTRGRSLFR